MEPHLELEQTLRRQVRRVRLTELAIAVGIFAVGVLLGVIRATQKAVSVVDPYFGEPYEVVQYPVGLTFAMQITFTLAFVALLWFALSFLYGKIDTVQAKHDFVTLYRGLFSIVLYVNGVEQDRARYYLEGKLSDRTTVTVSLSRNALWAHMTFSGGHPPVDL